MFGYSDGSINALATGGNGIHILFSRPYHIVRFIFFIIPFSEDANGCVSNPLEIILGEPDDLIASINSYNNISCFNGSDGSIDLNVTGGSLPYSFNWSNSNGHSNNNQNINNLSVGTYYINISDINNCSTSLQQEFSQPSDIESNFNTYLHLMGII